MTTRKLSTVELAEAAVLADISVLLVVAGWFLPATGVFWAASVVPFATLMVRHRLRAVIVGACSGAAIAFLALGPTLAGQVALAAFTGFVSGTSIKRNWGPLRTVGLALATTWTTGSALIVAFLALFSATRVLAFTQTRIQWIGTKHTMLGILRVTDIVIRDVHKRPWIVGAVELFPVLEGVVIARTNRRVFLLIRLGLLVVYTAIVSAIDVWLGVLTLASAAAAYLVAQRVHGRRLVGRVWIASAAVTALILNAGGKTAFFEAADVQWPWVRARLRSIFNLIAHIGDAFIPWYLGHWWWTLPLTLVVPVAAVTLLARGISRPIVRRLERSLRRPPPSSPSTAARDVLAGPVPVALEDVVYTYPNATAPALDHISLDIGAGVYVGVLGDNGSGKSTLARVLAGAEPTSGTVRRPGAAGLGHRGGTAIVFQRPESQVLGVRVREDVVWGLDDEDADVDTLLDLVGLGGFAARETSTLSGGELQRLAIAAALAREPKLIVSDESTAMVDPDGRRHIVALFASLAARGITVVHISHRVEEVAGASSVFVLRSGRVDASGHPEVVLSP